MERILNFNAVIDGKVEENLKFYGFSSRICNNLKKEYGLVLVNGEEIFLTAIIKKGDYIRVILKESPKHPIPKYNVDVDIVYQDDDVAVINKAPNIAVIATNAHYGNSLMNALANVWGDFVYHPVNRLDKGTSGLMLVAKHALAHSIMSDTLTNEGWVNEKLVKREYLAVVCGKLTGRGVIDQPIGQPFSDSMKRGVTEGGKRAVTYYEAECSNEKYTLVRLILATGRTHQIRVHMAYLGYPLAGDDLYGGDNSDISRPALHSCTIQFTHPIEGKIFGFDAQLPDDMTALIRV